jgi:transposase
MMHGAHIGGQRAAGFLELVGGIDPRRVLLVGIDVAKATWFVVASTLVGEVVVDGVRVVADRAGLAELQRLIATTRSRLGAQLVVVGIEAAGHHHQTLTAHLSDRGELVVRLVNPAQVAALRKQQGNRRRKTDWLDAAAICELLGRGEGGAVQLDASPASALRPLWSGRKDLVDARSRLRQQAGALVDCLWPGFSAKDTQVGVAPVLSDSFDTKAGRVVVGLLAEGWTPARIAATDPAELRRVFAARGCRLSGPLGDRLLARARSALPAHPAATAGKAATLAGLLGTLAALDRQIAGLEAEMAPLLAATQGAKLPQLRGVATVAAAGFVAFVGDTRRWSEWSKVWRAAGLDPARSQSGATDQRYGISREGSAWGRRAILDLAASVCRQPGPFQDGYRARTGMGHKHPKVALAATGNQLGRTCFALMASGADYDPDHQTKRAERRTTKHRKAGGQAA